VGYCFEYRVSGGGMRSLRELYRIGMGPSSSHSMGPENASRIFKERYPEAAAYRVTLYGSLAATGRGHLTDRAVYSVLGEEKTEILWKPEESLPDHPNGIVFEALDGSGARVGEGIAVSLGGGAVRFHGEAASEASEVYPHNSMDELLTWAVDNGLPFWRYVREMEGASIWGFLGEVWEQMQQTVEKGLREEGVLPGELHLERRARSYYLKVRRNAPVFQRTGMLAAYALAASEENAACGVVVTAPTCGSCGVLPSVLLFLKELCNLRDEDILKALATAGLIGNVVKQNASISGAEVGCQGEVGTACAMAAAAAAELMGGNIRQIEYAAEMGLEHHLGLTCDPVAGLVQIPCIERNAVAASRAVVCADLALLSDGRHRVSFDEVIRTMQQTGRDMNRRYRETSEGGLACYTHFPGRVKRGEL